MYFQQERQEAKKLFATENSQPAKAPAPPSASTFIPGEIPRETSGDDILEDTPAQVEELPRKGPTPEQIIAIKVLHFDFKACSHSICDYSEVLAVRTICDLYSV